MSVMYHSTRSENVTVSASYAIMKGLADDGGLYVPEEIPKLTASVKDLAKMDYKGVAYEVMKLFLSDFTEEELKNCIEKAYDEKFDTAEIAPLVEKDGAYYLELFHGKTIAFKDMALSILPHLMTTAAKKNEMKDKIVILTATSGDTGKAALEGFADVENTEIIVFYPKEGVSAIQEQQMVTQTGKNTHVIGIRGNFDDAQSGVKTMFSDERLKAKLKEAGFQFSSANSINIGRLVPQVVYYVYSYVTMVKRGDIQEGDKINVVVPTGNFGNILAGFYAKNMGIPIDKLYCASNRNKVLFDFFQSGTYDKNREFYQTSSPSMDILISSNLERLIYYISGNDPRKTGELMSALSGQGKYTITPDMEAKLQDFEAGFADEDQTLETIRNVYQKANYVIDPHTAVAASVYYEKASKSPEKTVVVSTASPYKFGKDVLMGVDESLDENASLWKESPSKWVEKLESISKVPAPKAVRGLMEAEILHKTVCDKDQMEQTVCDVLKI